MSQRGKYFIKRYYWKIDLLSLCRPVLFSGIVQSEHVAAGKVLKQRYYRNINILSFCKPMLLSGNDQSEHFAAGEVFQTTILSEPWHFKIVGQCYFPVTSNLNMLDQGKVFRQRYYRNLNNLRLCRPVLLSGNFQFEHVAAGEIVQTAILSEP